jgi:hypothetical protein
MKLHRMLVSCAAVIGLANSTPQSALSQTHPHVFITAAEVAAMKAASGTLYSDAYSALVSRIGYKEFMTMPFPTVTASVPEASWQGQTYGVHDYYSVTTGDRSDFSAAQRMCDAVRDLGIMWTLTGDDSYATRAFDILQAWCITPATRMNATASLYKTQSRIELWSCLPGMLYGMDLLYNHPQWSASDKAAEMAWVDTMVTETLLPDYLDWSPNNWRIWGTQFLAAAGALRDDPSLMNYAWGRFHQIINEQIRGVSSDSVGMFENELQIKANALSYSLFALSALIEIAHIADRQGVTTLWEYKGPDYQSLKLAMDALAPYLLDPSTWPYPQSVTFDATEAKNNGYQTYEMALLRYPSSALYEAVIGKYGRPVYDVRTAGPITLTHRSSPEHVATSFQIPEAPVVSAMMSGGGTLPTSAELQWSTPDWAEWYQVQISSTSSFASTTVDESELTSNSFGLSHLGTNSSYFCRVRAINTSGSSPWSDVLSFTTDSDLGSVGKTELTNLLTNGNFENNLSDWYFYTNGQGSFTSTPVASEGLKAARIAITTAGTNTQAYQKHLTLKPQTEYEFRFSARSSTGHDMNVSFLQDVSPYANYGLQSVEVDLDTAWRSFAIRFKTSGFASIVNDGLFRFWFPTYASAGDEYMIDDVKLLDLGATAVEDDGAAGTPQGITLEQNYPNPFNPETGIRYQVSGVGDVKLAVYDMLGREVAVLVNERKAPGDYAVNFDGAGLSSGVYIYRLSAGESVQTKKMTLLK